MVLENGETVRIVGKQGTFTIAESITNIDGDEGYRMISDKTLMQHFFRDNDIKPAKKKKGKKKGRA